MKDALAFLARMRSLLPDCNTSLTLGDNGLTITVASRTTGRWYSYILDADDLVKERDALAKELVGIHEQRSHGDEKRPPPAAGIEPLLETARKGWEAARVLAVTYEARFTEKMANEELAKLGRREEPAVRSDNRAIATADEREEAWADLVSGQCAFLKAYAWRSNGTGLWADPADAEENLFIWATDHAVMEQNLRIMQGVDPAPGKDVASGEDSAPPPYSVANAIGRIRAAARALPHGSHSRSLVDTLASLEELLVVELKRARAEGNP